MAEVILVLCKPARGGGVTQNKINLAFGYCTNLTCSVQKGRNEVEKLPNRGTSWANGGDMYSLDLTKQDDHS